MDIALALGGGGSRGNAHIGVLRVLEREGFRVRAVSGASFGGLVAALYAAGYSPDEIEALFNQVDQTRLYGRAPNDGPSLLGTAGIRKFLDQTLGQRTFDDLRLPCAMSAAELAHGCEVILNTGMLIDAVLATTAVPGIFPPHRIGDHDLVDGGVVNPVPVSLARKLAPSLPVVAVVLSASPEVNNNLFSVPMPQVIPNALLERLSQLRFTQAMHVFMQSIDIGQRVITELRLKLDEPDIIIRPGVEHIALLDRVDVSEIARLGEVATEGVLDELQRETSWSSRLRRKISSGFTPDA